MEGYAKLAELMGSDQTDGHFLIFHKFEQLSAQNLLYLQAEILNLQEDLSKCAKEDSESADPEKQLFTRDWAELSSSKDSEQWETWLALRVKLKEYYKAIAQHRMICSIPNPDEKDLKFLLQWLERPNMGNCSFIGADKDIYVKQNAAGLGSLASSDVPDFLTRCLLYALPRIFHKGLVAPFHRLFGKWIKKPVTCSSPISLNGDSRPISQSTSSTSTTLNDGPSPVSLTSSALALDLESNIFLYRDSYLHRTANILGTLISSLIPIAAIVVLYFVHEMTIRLAVVSLFTALFSVALSLVTGAKRVEIFAATAAFASVQVVFVGSVRGG